MKYEKSRQQFYESEIYKMAEQLSEILDNGYSVEISKSRSGLKIHSVSKKHVVVRRGSNNVSE